MVSMWASSEAAVSELAEAGLSSDIDTDPRLPEFLNLVAYTGPVLFAVLLSVSVPVNIFKF